MSLIKLDRKLGCVKGITELSVKSSIIRASSGGIRQINKSAFNGALRFWNLLCLQFRNVFSFIMQLFLTVKQFYHRIDME